MTSSRPYLLRALEQWIVDNDMTPFVVVDAQAENVDVPREYVEAGKIVLNIAPTAVANLNIDNEYLSFSARFSGKSREIWVPIDAVMAIYSRENGQGMVFAEEPSTPSPDPDNSPTNKKPDRPELKLVK
ncbi:MAG: ClpXP protease specificity-enhancing factor [Gammaproteobacteria bacterium]|nr:ClpXP protease specificity-enhancing factor [Gammaproteobacteria bacterium]MDH5729840.1 ClpXP protease specificity-enhancing factor [Gammaproteobacteria bacterium]